MDDEENTPADNPGENAIPGYPNLRPFSRSERGRSVEMGRLGGKAAGVARRNRKTLREAVIEYLDATLQPSHPKYAEITRMLRASGFLGPDEKPTNQHLIVFGLGQKASKDAAAFVALRDTAGERPVEQVEQIVTPPTPVVIGIHDPAFIAEERKKQSAELAMLESVRVQKERDAAEVVAVPVPLPAPEPAETSAPTRPPLDGNPPVPPTVAPTDAPSAPDSPESGHTPPVSAPAEPAPPSTPPEAPRPPSPEFRRHAPLPVDTPGRVVKHRPGKYVCIPSAFPRR